MTARRAADRTRVKESIVILDFGSQYSLLIARRVRELRRLLRASAPRCATGCRGGAQPEGLHPLRRPQQRLRRRRPAWRPPTSSSPSLPVLGICYGMQLLGHQLGGGVTPHDFKEYGPANIEIDEPSPLFADLPSTLAVWMSHGDQVTTLPPGFRALAHSGNSAVRRHRRQPRSLRHPVPPGGRPHASGR